MRRRTSTLATTAAAALTLLVAACGDGTGVGSETGAPPPKIRLGSGASGAAAPEASRMIAADDAYGSRVEFVLDGKLPGLDDAAPSWHVVMDDAPVGRIAALAAALGVTGEVVARAADEGGGWIVGSADGSAPALHVSSGALGDWWYSPGPIDGLATVACNASLPDTATPDGAAGSATSEPATPGASTRPAPATDLPAPADEPAPEGADCTRAEPPQGVPSADEARQRGTALLATLGVDVAADEIEVQGDEWGRSVTAWLVLDGLRAPLATGVSYGADGQVTWANGFLGTVEQGPDYPRAGTAAGVARLQEQWVGVRPLAMDGAAAAVDAPASEEDGADRPAVAPGPGATVAPPPTVTLRVTGVEASLWMVWNTPDDIWLVPAYTFTTDDGGEYSVVAVAEEYLDRTETAPVEEPARTTSPGDEERGEGAADAPGAPSPDEAARLVGLAEAEAAKVAETEGWGFRVVARDGEALARTEDHRVDRVNAHIEAGVVVSTEIG